MNDILKSLDSLNGHILSGFMDHEHKISVKKIDPDSLLAWWLIGQGVGLEFVSPQAQLHELCLILCDLALYAICHSSRMLRAKNDG